MTLLYSSPVFQEHRTGEHPERPERLAAILRHLDDTGLTARCQQPDWTPAARGEIETIHEGPYLDDLEAVAARGGGWVEMDTVMSARSFEAACLAAGAVVDAARRVLAGESHNALCLVRPPGHHALASAPMGFCLINHVAIAAAVAIRNWRLDRVLIVDVDVHHGNGTQDTFWDSENVGFLSIHRYPFYPGTGAADETGTRAGLGYTCNIPIAFGTRREDFHQWLRTRLERFADRVRPQLVFISAGFDAHRLDPVGSLGLEVEDYSTITECIQQVADVHAQGRIVSALEGGYNLSMLPACVGEHLERLVARDAISIRGE